VPDLDGTERAPPACPSPPHLLIVASDGTWTSRPLPTGGPLLIGRSSGVDIRVDERAVSRLHARLEVIAGGALRLVDLGSANGTLVGERLVHDAGVTVWPGEPILIGGTVLALHAPALVRAAEEMPHPPRPPERALAGVDALVAKAAPTPISVLLLGETGVGKGVIAARLHRLSPRAGGPWVQLNCAGLPAALLESELFGHERGAFTGAAQAKPGLLEMAAGGTVFLDEVGDMPMEVQAKLLLAIDQRVARRVGAIQSTPIDVRFISATNKDLEAEIRGGRFRVDFYHRIKGFTIRIPPLRERRGELDGLIRQFASDAATSMSRDRPPAFDPDARARLYHHDWPGNVRELRRIVESAVMLADDDLVTSRVLDDAGLPVDALPPSEPAKIAKRDRLTAALAACGSNQTRAAKMLGISRNTLIAWMDEFDLPRPRGKGDPR